MPPLRRLIPVPLMRKELSSFFTNTFNENVRFREQSGNQRHDFLDLLIQLKKGNGQYGHWVSDFLQCSRLLIKALIWFRNRPGYPASPSVHLLRCGL